jgi:hypothetical protein
VIVKKGRGRTGRDLGFGDGRTIWRRWFNLFLYAVLYEISPEGLVYGVGFLFQSDR